MSQLFIMSPGDYQGIDDRTGFASARIDIERADRHLAIFDARRAIVARCSLWWRETPRIEGYRSGAIGHYAATEERFGRELLGHACTELRLHHCGVAVGPLDGSTWRRYRFVTRRGGARPFFLEPDNPDGWPAHFRSSGFSTLARYISDLNPDIASRQPPLGPLHDRMQRLGVGIGPLNQHSPAADLGGIYDVVRTAFSDAPLYTPLAQQDFMALYAPLVTQTDPRLTLVARHEGRVVGFIFAPPDYLQPADVRDTLVIKTVAVLPERRYSGLGRVLVVALLQSATGLGYRKAISALMHAAAPSRKMSNSCAAPMREYELYASRLAG